MDEELSIKAVSQMTGLSEFTLRAWEKRYKAVTPRRNSSGRRVYRFADVEKLKLLSGLSESGQSIGGIAGFSLRKLKSLSEEVLKNSSVAARTDRFKDLLKCASRYDIEGLSFKLRAAQVEMDLRTFLIEVISPFLQRLGGEVEAGRLDLSQEHAASAVVRNLLSGVLYLSEQTSREFSKPAMVFATPENDLHEFGILISAVLARLAGAKAVYLGPNLPAKSVAHACRAVEGAVLVIGTATPESALSALKLSRYFSELNEHLPANTEIWVGGVRTKEMKVPEGAKARRFRRLNGLDEFDRLVRSSGRADRTPTT